MPKTLIIGINLFDWILFKNYDILHIFFNKIELNLNLSTKIVLIDNKSFNKY
jgi:hypothetical protein